MPTAKNTEVKKTVKKTTKIPTTRALNQKLDERIVDTLRARSYKASDLAKKLRVDSKKLSTRLRSLKESARITKTGSGPATTYSAV